jgi:hypothetical protein
MMRQRAARKCGQVPRRWASVVPAAASALLLAGCARAPSFSIVGSYFPAWLLCIIAGIAMAGIANWVLTRLKLGRMISWPVFVYPCLAAFFAFTLWLIFFS